MSDAPLEPVEALFHGARALEETERGAFLDRECGANVALRERVEELLAAHSRKGDLLDTPALGSDFRIIGQGGEVIAAPSGRIGAYVLRERIGDGGMGTVFLAEQDQPRRLVAIKVLRAGLNSAETIRRFRHEAEALGRLNHPGIARVHEAGVEGDVPFLAMEYVDGKPLTDYARARALSLREKLVLFVKVCDAVQHAHAQGVIHRDLKPANILVEHHDGTHQPRILDFGIARITSADAAHDRTTAGEILGTLQYMSPEQSAGAPDAVDARTDVYSLGVLLFELLSGALPFDLRGLNLPEAARVLAECDPEPLRGPELQGELAALAGKALERDPDRRYTTASELAADVRRYLDGRPILAHPPSASYQLHKLALRHRAAVVGIAAVALALAAGFATTLWQWSETNTQRAVAERRFEDLSALAQEFIFPLDSRVRNVAGTLEARRFLVETWLPYLDRLAAEERDSFQLQRDLAGAYSRIGDIQGSTVTPSLGDWGGAVASYRKSLAIVERLAAASTDHRELTFDRINLQARLGDALGAQGMVADSLTEHERALEVATAWAERAAPDDMLPRRYRAITAERVGTVLAELGRFDEALEIYEQVLAWSEAMVREDPEDPGLRRDVAVTHFQLGSLAARRGDPDRALEGLRAFQGFVLASLEVDPNDAVAQRDAIVVAEQIGAVCAAEGRQDDARETYAATRGLCEVALKSNAGNVPLLTDVTRFLSSMASFEAAQGRAAEARSAAALRLDVANELLSLRPDDEGFLEECTAAAGALAALQGG